MRIRNVVCVLIGLAMGVQLLTGCASNSKTYKETTTVTTAPADGSTAVTESSYQTSTTVKEETTSASTQAPSDGGIFGGVFHLLGEILAFPFRVIGGIFDAIF